MIRDSNRYPKLRASKEERSTFMDKQFQQNNPEEGPNSPRPGTPKRRNSESSSSEDDKSKKPKKDVSNSSGDNLGRKVYDMAKGKSIVVGQEKNIDISRQLYTKTNITAEASTSKTSQTFEEVQ